MYGALKDRLDLNVAKRSQTKQKNGVLELNLEVYHKWLEQQSCQKPPSWEIMIHLKHKVKLEESSLKANMVHQTIKKQGSSPPWSRTAATQQHIQNGWDHCDRSHRWASWSDQLVAPFTKLSQQLKVQPGLVQKWRCCVCVIGLFHVAVYFTMCYGVFVAWYSWRLSVQLCANVLHPSENRREISAHSDIRLVFSPTCSRGM